MPPDQSGTEVIAESQLKALNRAFTELLRVSDQLNPEQRGLLERARLLSELRKGQEFKDFIDSNDRLFKSVLLPELQRQRLPLESSRLLLSLVSENPILDGIYQQFGLPYKAGSADRDETSTDCVAILRKSPAFRALLSKNPIRTFNSGADLVFDEKLGKVVDVVDRKDFTRLSKFKPNKDHFYVFGLTKPPLQFQGRPNITHLQIPTTLKETPGVTSVIHASQDKGQVVIEENVFEYLATHQFERVYVYEIDLRAPFSENMFQREPMVRSTDHEGKKYDRPSAYNLPVVQDKLTLIHKEGDPSVTVPIYEEERRTLELITPGNRVLEYLTILTGVREGKIGSTQNIMEGGAFQIREGVKDHPMIGSTWAILPELARETFVDKTDPEGKSLGLHQVTKTVLPLFNEWIANLEERTATELGPEMHALWEQKQTGKTVEWAQLVPYLNSYDISDNRYENVQFSTICSYLLLKHLFEDQLMGAYKAYGETFFGLEEEPGALVAVASAYRSNVDVMVTGGQQYRVAELAYQQGLIDRDFNFTSKATELPFYASYVERVCAKFPDEKTRTLYKTKFQVDGYRGIQTQYLAYFCYLSAPEAQAQPPLSFAEFELAYGTTQLNMLKKENKAVEAFKKLYEAKLHRPAKLLMDEDELRAKNNTPLNTLSIDFANEGLWVLAHYNKLTRENWDQIYSKGDGFKSNPIVEGVLEQRSDRSNDISKIPTRDGLKLAFAIHNTPGNPWYLKYPEPLLAACLCNKDLDVFKAMRREQSDSSEDWIKKTQDYVASLFSVNLRAVESELEMSFQGEDGVAIAVASSQIDTQWIIQMLKMGTDPKHLVELYGAQNPSDTDVLCLAHFQKGFYAAGGRFSIKDAVLLERKDELNEREQREKFAIRVYQSAVDEALKRGYGKDLALVATAQACIEASWGDSNNLLVQNANNLFGSKANYTTYGRADFDAQDLEGSEFYISPTYEIVDGKREDIYAAFKKFPSIQESIVDYFDHLEELPNYALALDLAQSAGYSATFNNELQTNLVDAIAKGGYSTNPAYGTLVRNVGYSVEGILAKYGVDI